MPRSSKQASAPRVRRRVCRNTVIADSVVEGHIVVIVAQVDLAIARDAERNGIVRVLRLLVVVGKSEDLPIRRIRATVEIPPAEGNVLAVVGTSRFVVGDVLP